MDRRWFLAVSGTIAGVLGVLLFANLLGANTVYYLEPREALAQRADLPDGESFRLGGVVVEGSVTTAGDDITFTITDFAEEITVRTDATPPELFTEGVPVILDGSFSGDAFVAEEILLRHEENYETPEDGEDYDVDYEAPPEAEGS
ncbi:MAG: cytochrome c maturation protein CcmE [Acidimicrobiia bacterium]